jgi:cellobiose phosphorylase
MIARRDAHPPTHGEAKNSWPTGIAARNLVAITQWILGIRPDYDGRGIVPASRRPGRRSTPPVASEETIYRIHVAKPSDVRVRVSHPAVDGQCTEANLVPIAGPAATIVVNAVTEGQ